MDARTPLASRRDFLKASGLIVVSVGAVAASVSPLVSAVEGDGAKGQGTGPYPDPDFRQLDSWIVIH
ncbi:uncharacterized protein METZ01_LOCUS129665, partial [marine metagenome]